MSDETEQARGSRDYKQALILSRLPGLKRAIGWVDYYLAMRLKDDVRASFEELRRRLVYEQDNGPSTSTLMGGDSQREVEPRETSK